MKKYLVIILVLLVIILSGTTFYFWIKSNLICSNKKCVEDEIIDVKEIFRKSEVKNEEYKVENVNEFKYNYQDTEFAEKEKQVLEIAKKRAILIFGEKAYKEDIPYKVVRKKSDLRGIDYIWHFSGTLLCPCKDDGCICFGGTIEVIITDKNLKVLKFFHSA